ncbi:hypothetical protein ABZP36_003910 [Zizania latifolia]
MGSIERQESFEGNGDLINLIDDVFQEPLTLTSVEMDRARRWLWVTGIGIGRGPLIISRVSPILSTLEDSPANIVERSDGQIHMEDDSQPEPELNTDTLGGTAQT